MLHQEKCLDYLSGMFSFGIYNQDTKKLFLARDHFGIKPIFYTQTTEGFAFASELKTLISYSRIQPKLSTFNPSSAASITYGYPENESMFVGCHKLPPAHFMYVNKELELTKKRYWQLEDFVKDGDEKMLIQALREVS